MRYLALDIGSRRTGVAYAESDMGIPFPLETIQHTSLEELEQEVHRLLQDRSVDRVIIGLPLLPSGEEGEQVEYVRSFLPFLEGIPYELVDERYTTPKGQNGDGDSHAACQILSVILDRQ